MASWSQVWTPQRKNAFKMLSLVLFGVLVILTIQTGHRDANRDYHASRRYWGNWKVAKVDGCHDFADIYYSMNCDFSYTDRQGRQRQWSTTYQWQKDNPTALIYWEGTDGNIFVAGSINVDDGKDAVRKYPWPSANKVAWKYGWANLRWAFAIGLFLGLIALLTLWLGKPKSIASPVIDDPEPDESDDEGEVEVVELQEERVSAP